MPSFQKHEDEQLSSPANVEPPPPAYKPGDGVAYDLSGSGCSVPISVAAAAAEAVAEAEPSSVFNTDAAMNKLKGLSDAVPEIQAALNPGPLQMLIAAFASTVAVASDPVFKVATADEVAVKEGEADDEYNEFNGAFDGSLAAVSTSLEPYLNATPTTEVLDHLEQQLNAEWPSDFCPDEKAKLLEAITKAKDDHKDGIIYEGHLCAAKEHLTKQFSHFLSGVNAVFNAEPTEQGNPAPQNLSEAEQQLNAAARHEEQERDEEMSDCRKNHRERLKEGLDQTNAVLAMVREMIKQIAKVKDTVESNKSEKESECVTAACIKAQKKVSKTLKDGAAKLESQRKEAQKRCDVASDRHKQRAKAARNKAKAALKTAKLHESGHHGEVGLSYAELGQIISTGFKTAAEQQKIADFETTQCNHLWFRMQQTDEQVDAILEKYQKASHYVALQKELVTSNKSMLDTAGTALLSVCATWMSEQKSQKQQLLLGVAKLTATLLHYYTTFEELPGINMVKYFEGEVTKAKADLVLQKKINTPDKPEGVKAARAAKLAAEAGLKKAKEELTAASATIAALLQDQKYEEVLAEIKTGETTSEEKVTVAKLEGTPEKIRDAQAKDAKSFVRWFKDAFSSGKKAASIEWSSGGSAAV